MTADITRTSAAPAGNIGDPDFSSVIDLLEEGVAVFDRERRLAFCNAAFSELFPKIREILQPGIELAVFARASQAAGYGLNTSVQRQRDPARRRLIILPRGPIELQIADGRWLWIKDRPRPDGGLVLLRRDITKRKLLDIRLNLALDAVNKGIWDWDPIAWTIFFNPDWKNSLGYEADAFPLYQQNWGDYIHPEDRAMVAVAIAGAVKGETQGFDVAFRYLRKDGSWAWLKSTGRVAERDPRLGTARRIVGLHQDISQQREAEIAIAAALERANKAEERLRTAIEVIPEGFILFDSDGRLVCVNKAYCDLDPRLGEALRQGMSLEEFVRAGVEIGAINMPPEKIAGFIAKRRFEIEQKMVRRDIEIAGGRWLHYVQQRTPDGGYVGLRVDITERKNQERALREALAEAEAANHSKTQFLANMSHELRTPLNAILGFSEIIREGMMGPVAANYAEYAGNIHTSGTHLLKIINDILDLSKITLSSVDLYDELVDPRELIQSCVTLIRPQAHIRGLTVIEEVPHPLPLIKVDLTRIKQVLLNLLSNAKKYTAKGGQVIFSVAVDGEGLRFIIRDTGIGMEHRDIPVALEAFRQVGELMSRHHEGTGLGLPIAKAMIEAHGGTLEIASTMGVGTTVTVRLPPSRVVWPDRCA